MTQITVSARGVPELLAALEGAGRESDLATLFALRRVGALSRTRIVRAVAKEVGAPQKAVRPHVRVYPGNLRKMRVRVWHGLAARLRHKEAPAAVKKTWPAARLMTMRDGYTGRFREHRNGTVTEATIDLEPAVERHAESIVTAQHDERFESLYDRDFERRLRRKGWRRNTRR